MDGEETPQERVAIVLDHLVQGECLITVEIAKMFGLNRRSAQAMMTRIQRKVPRIFFDHDSYKWVYDGGQSITAHDQKGNSEMSNSLTKKQ